MARQRQVNSRNIKFIVCKENLLTPKNNTTMRTQTKTLTLQSGAITGNKRSVHTRRASHNSRHTNRP